MEYIFGKHSVENLLEIGKNIDRIYLLKNGSFNKIYKLAKENNIEIRFVDKRKLDELSNGGNHQGAVALTDGFKYTDLNEFLETNHNALIIMLDGIEDPHNLGAMIRTAECAGADLIIIPDRRSAEVNETVRKVASGAAELMKVSKVKNLSRTIEFLKKEGYWIYAADMDGELYYNAPLERPLVLIIGGEGNGVSRIVKEHADGSVSIPLKGRINSLNASNALAVLLYEVVRREIQGS